MPTVDNPCPVCGLTTHRGKGCPKRKRTSGKKPKREIFSFDCETNSHGIVLFLACGESRDDVDYLYNGEGLKLEPILNWLIQAGTRRLCFGFFFDYDVNQIVALLPEIYQGQLAAKGSVSWRGYQIRHTPGKKFQVSSTIGSVCIWDCSSWAATSFLRLCQDWKLGTEAERELIARMKAKRGDFEDEDEDSLVAYTTLECCLLSQWVHTLLKLHEDCGIQLRAYSGPGSTASAMIRQRGWKPPEVPPKIQEIAEKAFFGGRTEISCIGPVAGPVYGYDINSAYPTAVSRLPEIRDKEWKRTKRYKPDHWGFYKVRWKQKRTDPWGLFPIRGAMLPTGRRSVSLLYPTDGEGWFHSHEVAAALEVNPAAVTVLDGYVIEPTGQPFAWIHDVATMRLEYKAKGDMKNFPLKVGLNSIYGKLAQHSGTHPLQCITYAAAVTAWTRGELLKAAYSRGHSVILLATDGILSTEPLPELPIGSTLGTWERDEYESAWMLQAGVYWCGRKKRTRGIDARSLELEDVENLWFRKETAAVLTLPSRRVMSYRLCNAQGKLSLTGTWYDGQRSVRFSPQPRRRSFRWRGDRLLTVPALTADYTQVATLDQIVMGITPGSDFDEFEALPEWAQPD